MDDKSASDDKTSGDGDKKSHETHDTSDDPANECDVLDFIDSIKEEDEVVVPIVAAAPNATTTSSVAVRQHQPDHETKNTSNMNKQSSGSSSSVEIPEDATRRHTNETTTEEGGGASTSPVSSSSSSSPKSGLGAWFATVRNAVVSEAAAARDMVTSANSSMTSISSLSQSLNALTSIMFNSDDTNGTTTSSSTATATATAGGGGGGASNVTGSADRGGAFTGPCTVRLVVQGLCNVADVSHDVAKCLHLVSVKQRSVSLGISGTDISKLRTFVIEEILGTTLEYAYIEAHKMTGQINDHDVVCANIQPVRCGELLVYVIALQGLGSIGRCISQSVRVLPESVREPDWERRIIQSAVRSAAEDWMQHANTSTSAAAPNLITI